MKQVSITIILVVAWFIAGYSIGFERGKSDWERGIKKTMTDTMQKLYPGVPFEWRGDLTSPGKDAKEDE